jgi:hypothetical protein
MTITNKLGLPLVLVRALERDPYTRGASRYSVTQLIDAPKVRVLRNRHADQISRDISDSVWLLLGKGVHHILEHGAAERGDPDHTVEERIFVTVRGVVISGQMDIQSHPSEAAEIIDWKVTSTYRISNADGLKKWEEQLNSYATIRAMAKDRIAQEAGADKAEKDHPGNVSKLTIVAFLRDWSKSKARQNKDYPQAPVVSISLPLWPLSKGHAFVHDRVKAHLSADMSDEIGMEPEPCTDEDRWMRPGTYEVVQITKDGREWVRNTFDGDNAKQLAHAQMQDNIAKMKVPARTWVRERPAVPVRCMDWCEAAPFCDQWRSDPHNTTP